MTKLNKQYRKVIWKIANGKSLSVRDRLVFDQWHNETSLSEKERFYTEKLEWKK